MKIHWSARNIPELAPFRATQRAVIIQMAARAMPLPRRYLANALKLVVLSVLFWQLVSIESWAWRIVALLATGLLYPLLLHPLTLNLAKPYLAAAADDYRREHNDTDPPKT